MLEHGSIGGRIAALRQTHGYTQEELGALLSVTAQAVSKWETGKALPDISLLPPLARVLHISIDRLILGREGAQTGPYDAAYAQAAFYWGQEASALAQDAAALLTAAQRPVARVLDVGSGEGRDSIYFACRGFTVDALELSAPGVEKIRRFSAAARCSVNVLHADMIGYVLPRAYDLIYSMGSVQFLPLEKRRETFASYKAHTLPGGLNAHLAFVEKPYVAPAPDWEREERFYRSGELAGYYWDWEILRYEECLLDCNSSGTAHQHVVCTLIARMPDAP